YAFGDHPPGGNEVLKHAREALAAHVEPAPDRPSPDFPVVWTRSEPCQHAELIGMQTFVFEQFVADGRKIDGISAADDAHMLRAPSTSWRCDRLRIAGRSSPSPTGSSAGASEGRCSADSITSRVSGSWGEA